MKIIKDLKRQVIRNLKAMIAPHCWKSQYEGTMLFAFAPLDVANRERKNRSMGSGVFNRDLTCCQGFYTEGVIDAVGGGCACYPFESFCLEDLLTIETWVTKNFHKEVDRHKKLRHK